MTDELVKYDLRVINAHVLHSLPAGPDPRAWAAARRIATWSRRAASRSSAYRRVAADSAAPESGAGVGGHRLS